MSTPFDTLTAPLAERIADGLDRLAVAGRAGEWSQAGGDGLTPTQLRILRLLRARAGGPLRVSEIAAEVAVTAPTVSDSIAALVRKGLLTRTASPADRRAADVLLTASGHQRSAEMAAGLSPLAVAAAALADEEQQALLRSVFAMILSLQRHGAIPVARMCINCSYFRPFVHRGGAHPHHCDYVDAPFGDRHLRIACGEYEAAPAARASAAAARFLARGEGATNA